jgi:hypothetical protein
VFAKSFKDDAFVVVRSAARARQEVSVAVDARQSIKDYKLKTCAVVSGAASDRDRDANELATPPRSRLWARSLCPLHCQIVVERERDSRT